MPKNPIETGTIVSWHKKDSHLGWRPDGILRCAQDDAFPFFVIPAKAGIPSGKHSGLTRCLFLDPPVKPEDDGGGGLPVILRLDAGEPKNPIEPPQAYLKGLSSWIVRSSRTMTAVEMEPQVKPDNDGGGNESPRGKTAAEENVI